MRVFVDGAWRDATFEPLAVELDTIDKERIAKMPRDADIYFAYPIGTDPGSRDTFIKFAVDKLREYVTGQAAFSKPKQGQRIIE